jgi:predicted TIM-barrel fold metal-dependent hydrolase
VTATTGVRSPRREGLRILDADAHVVEPGALFQEWAPPGRAVLDLPATTPIELCGDSSRLADQLEHGFDPPSYLRAMDQQGIDAAVLFPSMGLFVPYLPELDGPGAAAACAAYNEWVADYCAAAPQRLAAVGVVPQRDATLAAAEASRAAHLGLVGVLVRPNHIGPHYLDHHSYDALYGVLAEAGVVLGVHEALGVRAPTIGRDRFDGFAIRHACSHPLEQMAAAAAILLGGVCERHPNLRVAFLESGTGWLPYWLARLDEHRAWMHDTECASLSLSPSEYFDRQCVISSDPEDTLAGFVIRQVGADHVMWASDFPHPDAAFPDAVEQFLARLDGIDVDLPRVLWQTPADFYRLAERFAAAPNR